MAREATQKVTARFIQTELQGPINAVTKINICEGHNLSMLPCRFNPPMLAFVFLPHVSPLRPPLSPLSSVRCTRTAVATRPPREARAPVCVCVCAFPGSASTGGNG